MYHLWVHVYTNLRLPIHVTHTCYTVHWLVRRCTFGEVVVSIALSCRVILFFCSSRFGVGMQLDYLLEAFPGVYICVYLCTR